MQQESINLNYWRYLEKHRWRLIQQNGNLYEGDAYLNFDLAQSCFTGHFEGVNLSGKFNSLGENIEFSELKSESPDGSKLESDEAVAKKSEEFLKNLTKKNLKFDVADQTLNIYENGKIILMFGRCLKE